MTHNWNAVQDETTQYLQDLIRLDTTNPPGNEILAADYLAGVFKREGIEPTVLESEPGRGNLVARLKGDGRAAPLLLMAHIDVVPAEADQWMRPPFSGDIAEGYLWGRGTIDTKDLVAMELMVMLMLKREGKTLARDIIFMANADEEAGGHKGAGWMVKNHPDLIRAEYAINEGAGFAVELFGRRFFTCQTGEKGTTRFMMRTKGKPGHGSQPHRDNAVVKLAEAVRQIGALTMPHHVTATTRLFLEGVAANVDKRYRNDLLDLLDAKKYDSAIKRLGLDSLEPMLYAMLHNTATPTMLNAGSKVNVIPSVAEARCDGRILPGQTAQDFLRDLRGAVSQDVEIELIDNTPGLESDFQTPLFDTITQVMARHDANAPVLPYLVVGATDARHVNKLGTKVYGFTPMIAPPEELDHVHAHNERISLDNIGFGARVLYEIVSEFAAG